MATSTKTPILLFAMPLKTYAPGFDIKAEKDIKTVKVI